jgi:pyruvate formate lyase activating enzyme
MRGGVTFSGGEPALQAAFIEPIARQLKERKIHLALDTCGKAPRSAFDRLLPWMDLLLFDIKAMDTEEHRAFTGLGNETILENLQYIAAEIKSKKLPARLWIRTPLIPELTATHSNINQIGTFINEHLVDVVDRWELCAFNALCADKYKQQGKDWALENTPLLSAEEMSNLLNEAKRTACSIATVTASGLTKK